MLWRFIKPCLGIEPKPYGDQGALYDDGVYQVTPHTVTTPTKIYPVDNCQIKIRRDPLWIGLGLMAFFFFGLSIYRDLTTPEERVIIQSLALVSLLIGLNIRIMQLHAFGHTPALIIGRPGKIKKIFAAIREARSKAEQRIATKPESNEAP